MNAEDVRSVSFDRIMRGYRPEEVDAFLEKVAAELERRDAEKADTEKKIYILAEKVDQYRDDEETLKTALLNAQRMGESVIREARQKADTIIYDATNRANQAREEAIGQVQEQEMLLARLKAEVAHFKGEVLNLYKQHIESLSLIPGVEEKKKKAAQEPEQPEEQPDETGAQANEPEAPETQAEQLEPEQTDSDAKFTVYEDVSFDE